MLSVLRIRNFALAKNLEIEFGPGLNVITGETGSGKSLILKSIAFLAGRRADVSVVRTGEEKCEIEAIFELSEAASHRIASEFPALELNPSESELLLKRTLDTAGKSRLSVNGSLVTAANVQKLSSNLFDITGQHQQQGLLDSARHRQLLDAYGVTTRLLRSVAEVYEQFALTKRKLADLGKTNSERAMRVEKLQFEHEQLSSAGLRAGEKEELQCELKAAGSFEQLQKHLSGVLVCLEGTEQSSEHGAVELLTRARGLCEKSSQIDPKLGEAFQLADSALANVSELEASLTSYLSSMDANPARLEYLRERIAEIAHLERRFGKSESELVEYFRSIQAELEAESGGGETVEELEAALALLSAQFAELAKKLTAERKRLAKKLSSEVVRELAQVNMPHAQFEVCITDSDWSATGADSVEFLLSANPGTAPQPLSKVASGGELSRVLLVMKTMLNEQSAPMLQVFDEVDAGIGGAVAQVVGEKLKNVSKQAQVIVVTHAPQIASQADIHLLVSKTTTGEQTTSSVSILSKQERVHEIARMLAGRRVTTKFEESARELIANSAD